MHRTVYMASPYTNNPASASLLIKSTNQSVVIREFV